MDQAKPQRKQDSESKPDEKPDGPSKRDQALAAKKRGNTAFAAQEWKTAIKEFTDAIELDPTDHVFYSNRSGCYANLKEYKTALEDARKCVATKPDWPKGYSRVGLALYQMGEYDDAKSEYEKGLKIAPDNATLIEGLSQTNKALQRSSNPMAKFFDDSMWAKLHNDPVTREYLKDPTFVQQLKALQKNPQMMGMMNSDKRMQAALGVLLGIGSSFGSGGKDDDDASSKDESESESTEKKEPAKKESAKKETAKKETVKKDTIIPMEDDSSDDSAEEVEVMTSAQQEEKKKKDEADRMERKKKQQEKKNKALALAEKTKGNELYKQKKFDEALVYYNKAIELDPTDMVYLLNVAASYSMKKEFQKSIDICKKALLVGRKNRADYKTVAKAYARMGNAYKCLDQMDDCIKAYSDSLLENRDDKVKKLLKQAEKRKSRLATLAYQDEDKSTEAKTRGNALFKEQKWIDAIKEYDEAIKRNPKNHIAFSNRAACFMKLMDWNRGIADCDECIRLKPDFVKAYTRKGRTQHFMKQYHKAIETFDQGLKFEPENAELLQDKQKTVYTVSMENQSGKVDPKRAEQAMKDPEIQAILADPHINEVLKNANTNPEAAQAAFADPVIRQKIQKLVNAGILQMGPGPGK